MTEDQDVLLRNVDGKMVPWELRVMSEPKHTPRPWHVHINGREIYAKFGSGLSILANVNHPAIGTLEANARLIAGAPDTYELLRQARPYVAECARSSASDGTRTAAQQFLARLIRGIEAAGKDGE